MRWGGSRVRSLGLAVLLAAAAGCRRTQTPEQFLDAGARALFVGNFRAAVASLSAAIKGRPSDARAYYLRGLARRELQELPESIGDFSKALELDPALSGLYHQRALSRRALGDGLGALADLDRGLEARRTPELLHLRSTLLGSLGRRKDAEKDADEALALRPAFAAALRQRGDLRLERWAYDDAVADYTAAIAAEPAFAPAYLSRAAALRDSEKREQYDAALADVSSALKIIPGMIGAFEQRAEINEELYRYDEAIKDLTAAVAVNPAIARLYRSRGAIHVSRAYQQRDLAEIEVALRDLDQAIALAPKVINGYLRRASARKFKKDFAGATADLSEALKINSKSAGPLNGLCAVHRESGDPEKSLPFCERAVDRSPRYANAYMHRCMTLESLERLREALQDCDRAVEYDPFSDQGYIARAGVRSAMKDHAGALADCDEALRLAPSSKQAADLRASIVDLIGLEAKLERLRARKTLLERRLRRQQQEEGGE